ncbi:hypothetical protein FACS18942_00600 [Planctomycetales bacterium]|nr:hypothetical protein FACS18942_00600 [Planctomycetales bacterium]
MNTITPRSETEALLHEKLQSFLTDLDTAGIAGATLADNIRFRLNRCSVSTRIIPAAHAG